MSITVGTNSWISLADADIYMLTRIGATRIWKEETTLPDKEAALVTAFNTIKSSGLWTMPAIATQNMKNAQCEMALFLMKHQEDADARGGLQAQGVVAAGIVQETYDPAKAGEVPVPAIVTQLLKEYAVNIPIGGAEIARDEDEEI